MDNRRDNWADNRVDNRADDQSNDLVSLSYFNADFQYKFTQTFIERKYWEAPFAFGKLPNDQVLLFQFVLGTSIQFFYNVIATSVQRET